MFNRTMDRIVNASASFAMRKYRTYPAAKTAVLFVNVQKAFTDAQQSVVPHLRQLDGLARSSGFRVVHAPYGGNSQRYPSPGHVRLTELLATTDNGDAFTPGLEPRSGDISLGARPSLSAFMKTDLHARLQEAGIEHLVVAGPYANLALDSTVRDAAQLDYHVTLVVECLGTASEEETGALKTTLPRYAQTVTDFQGFAALVRASADGDSR